MDKKKLIVYFSHTGKTKEVANQIHLTLGGDLVEILPLTPYPSTDQAVREQSMKEMEAGIKPPLATRFESLDEYDTVFIGSPMWWNTVVPPMRTFLSSYDFSGKTLAPFIIHAGSELGGSMEDIAALCPKATLLDGLAIWDTGTHSAQSHVDEWLSKLGILH